MLAGVLEVSNPTLLYCLVCRTTAMGWIDYGLKPETLMEKKSFFFWFSQNRVSSVSLAVLELAL